MSPKGDNSWAQESLTTDRTLLGVRLPLKIPGSPFPLSPWGTLQPSWGILGTANSCKYHRTSPSIPNFGEGGSFPEGKVLANLFHLNSTRLARASGYQPRSEANPRQASVFTGLLQSTLPKQDQVTYPTLAPLRSPLLSHAQQHCPQEGQPLACQPPWPEVHGRAAQSSVGSPVCFPEPPCSPLTTLTASSGLTGNVQVGRVELATLLRTQGWVACWGWRWGLVCSRK